MVWKVASGFNAGSSPSGLLNSQRVGSRAGALPLIGPLVGRHGQDWPHKRHYRSLAGSAPSWAAPGAPVCCPLSNL